MFTKMTPPEGQAGKKRRVRKRKRNASQTLANGSSHTEDSRGEGTKGLETEGGKTVNKEGKATSVQVKQELNSDMEETLVQIKQEPKPAMEEALVRVKQEEKSGIEETQTPTNKKRKRSRSKKRQINSGTNDTPSAQSQQVAEKMSMAAGKQEEVSKGIPTAEAGGSQEGHTVTEPKKKKKRNKKKKKKLQDDTSSTPVESSKEKEKKKISQVSNDSSGVSVNEGRDDVRKQEETTTKKTKEGIPTDTPVTQKNTAADATVNGEPGKKKRKRKKRKLKQTGTSESMEEMKTEEEEVEEVPAKKLKKGMPTAALDSHKEGTSPSNQNQDKPRLTKSQKRNLKRRQKKAELKKQTADTDLPNSSSDLQTQTATGAVRDSKHSHQQTPILHPTCRNQENKEKIKTCWIQSSKKGVFTEGKIEVIKTPFHCCYIPNLLENEQFLEGVKNELENIQFISKNNDLYKFQQTDDLKSITTPFISRLRHLLYTDIRQWLIDVTGIPLNDTVDMGSSRYNYTDVLLCHDDELEGRRIAYILYLVPPWGPKDGGSLDLFSTDEHGDPKDIVRSLIPKSNAFAFFEVSPISFHQVSEVLSHEGTRLSINGWFHGPPVPWPKRKQPSPPPMQGPGHIEEEDFYAWINPIYLDMEMQKEIRHQFCSESQLELENFLSDEAYEKLSEAFKGESLPWVRTGPPNRQCYEVLDPDNMPQEVKDCWQFLKSEALFLILSQLTGLKLHPMAPQDSDDEEEETSDGDCNPRGQVEAQRWSQGCYTLIRDDCVDRHAALDAFLYANVSEHWMQDLGGHVTYIAKDEDEELLTVIPRSNCLSLVYRDAQTLRFTKYINAEVCNLDPDASKYHSFACAYYE